MQLGLDGKTVLITGAERGIGQAIALAFAAEGARVAIADDRLETGPASTLERLQALGSEAIALTVDVSQEDQVSKMVQDTLGAFGHLDVFVGNAAIHRHEPVTQITTEAYRKVLDTNLSAAIWGCREVCRHMVPRRRGAIVLIASTIVLNPGYKEAVYRVTKAGIRAYAGTLALEMAPYGIRVCTISPGMIYTPLAQTNVDPFFASDPKNKERLLGQIPLGRLGKSEDVAPFALLFASEKAAYATGCDVIVDGGFALHPLVLLGREEIVEMNI